MKYSQQFLAKRLYVGVLILGAMLIATAIMAAPALTRSSEQTPPAATAEMASAVIAGGSGSKIAPPEKNAPPLKSAPSGPVTPQAPNAAANYTFSTGTSGSLTDMSSGTTQLLAANVDDTASALTNIGFDFFFQSTSFTQFSINENGVLRLGAVAQTGSPYQPLGQAGLPIVTAYGADQRTHAGDGKVHFKVTGAAPNRVLVVEWLNNQSNFNTGGTADVTYQVRLSETTGVIEFVYGGMTMSTLGAADSGSRDPNIGFSSSNVAGTVGSVTAAQSGVPAPTFDGFSPTPVANLYTAGAITVLTSAANGSRRTFTFTPPTPTAPTNLTFTGVAPLSMTLNWTDSANEMLYEVHRSTDGVSYVFDGTAAQNATSYPAAGLIPATTYFWRVFAISEGAFSTALSGSQMTSAGGSIASVAAGGNWNNTTTWVGGNIPTNTDNVTLVDGATVTIDTAAVALSLTVGAGGSTATLVWDSTAARTLTVGATVTVATNGVFQTPSAGAITTHVLSVGANLTNNGVLDFNTLAGAAAAGITFTGAASNTFSGTGATTDIRTLTINKGTSNTSVLELNTSNFSIQDVATDVAGYLTLTNGTFKLSGSFIGNNRVFTVAAYTISATAGFWLNNPNYTVAEQTGNGTVAGLFRITQGTFNVGTAIANQLGFNAGATVIVEGGAVNATGRFGVAAAANAVNYTQTAGTIRVCTVGNASTTLASFDLGTSLLSSITISGGTIVNQLANTAVSGPRDYRNQAGNGIAGVTGGTLQLGNNGSGAAKAFTIGGVIPNLVITNTTGNHTATILTPAVNFNNSSLNITINTGNAVNLANAVFLFNGTTLTNNGTITHNGASSNFVWFLATAPVSYTGSGAVTAPMTSFEVQATMGLTIDPASLNIIVGAIRLISGSVINSSRITLGNGAATTGIVQIGNTTTATAAGTFDVPFTFNLGTGGQTISYLRTTTARTTGPEVHPTRILTSMTYDDNDPTHNLTIAGGDLTLSSAATALTMANGRIITGANNLILSSGTGAVARPNGYVDGNFRKTYAAPANKTFEVGTASEFSPVAVNITAGTFPATFTAKAVQGPQPNILSPTHALQRYWTLTATGVTADLTFNYLDPTDIPVTAVENNFVILKYDGMFTAPGGSVNTGANTANITGVTSFSDWTLGEPNSPTAVEVASLTATEYDTGTYLQWQTGLEVANLGFNVYRDEAGKRVQVNPQLIGGAALLAGANTVLRSGKGYSWWIGSAHSKSNTQYWLEAVDLSGQSTWHGPIAARRIGGSPPAASDAALLSRVGVAQSQTSASSPIDRGAGFFPVSQAQIKRQGGLAGKPAVKISVRREGWYRVPLADLLAAGFDSKSDPQMLQMYVDGRQVPITVNTDQRRIAGVDFYGRGIDAAFTNARVYWLVAGAEPGLRMQQVKGEGYPTTSTSFLYTVERKDRTIYFASLRNGEKENFFGPVIAGDPVDQAFTLAHVDQPASAEAQLEVALQGVTLFPHRVWAYVNGTFAGELLFSGQAVGTAKLSVSQSALREGENQVRLVSQGGPGDVSLVDYLRLGYFHGFKADSDALRFTAIGGQAVTIDGFSSDAIRVLDVTDPDAVEEVVGKVEQQKGGYSITVASPRTGERMLLAALDEERNRPDKVTENRLSNLRSAEHAANFVIITSREMLSSVEALRARRTTQGYSVEVVDVEDIFDEFSFGNKSPQAMRGFLQYAQAVWKVAPRFVLFAGDASLDPKGYLGLADSDLVPTKLIDTALMESASDEWLADFDGDGLAELAIGRLPARTAGEAARMIEKIVAYDQSNPSESIMLVADSTEGFDFEGESRDLRALTPPNLRVDEINRGQMDSATARSRLIGAINRGAKVVNYIGHGSVNLWRGGLLTNDDATAMTNMHLPLFVMTTCLNGYFQDPALDSLAESLVRAQGGAVAVWASSGMTGPGGQAAINGEMFKLIFRSSNIKGQPLTFGEATLRAKKVVGDTDVRRTYILFGDPTGRLR